VVDKIQEVKMIMDGIKRRKIRNELKKVGVSSNKEFIGRGRNKRKNPNYDPRMGTSKKQDFVKNPLKIDNKGLTPNVKKKVEVKKKAPVKAKTETRAEMLKRKTGSTYDPTKANRAGQKMGQRKAGGQIKKMAYGGMAKKKMMGGGMAMKYGHGGTVAKGKKCPRDGIAKRGKTRA